ncbi:MAG: protein kinase [Calothrix sp. MO_167.B42]|nr:protein kinase [Calothrix sp. MO_167.B42]
MTTIKLLNNRYQVIQVLGSGGFGETFLAEDTHMPSRRRCVIKQLKPVTNNDPKTYEMIQQRFEREAATLEYLGEGSDCIPKLYAYFSENGQFYLVQEWIQGKTLTDIIESQGTFNEAIVREIVINLLSVLNYVHSKGIIHRDIKPDNIILQPSSQPWGKPILIDFGAVKETIRSVVNSSGVPTPSIVIGTPGYMSREQGIGHPVYATDLYSLGLTAIFLLTGKHPQQLPANPQTGEITWQNHASGVSADFAMVIDRAIKPNVSDRYSTAMQMLSALQASPSVISSPTPYPKTKATIAISPGNNLNNNNVNNQETQPLSSSHDIPTVPPPKGSKDWQKPALIVGSLLVGGFIGAVAIATMNRQPEVTAPVTQATTPTPENTEDTNPVVESPFTTPPESIPNNSNSESNPVVIPNIPPSRTTPTPTPSLPLETSPSPLQPETTSENTQPSPPLVTSPTTPPVASPPPQKQKTPNTAGQVPAFPAGAARKDVEAVLGKKRDLKGLWGDTRAVTYKVVPNQIDLGYLFDRNSGELKQTEVGFAQSVDPQLMQDTLNGMLAGQATPDIQQGLKKIQQRQSDNFEFSLGAWKGQIIRQDCGFIYISVWDANLHDFVDPSTANKC